MLLRSKQADENTVLIVFIGCWDWMFLSVIFLLQ